MPQTYDVILKGGTVVNQDGRVARDIGVTGGKIMALGDQENDIAMIEFAGMGVAMDNAIPSVKEVANFVTKSNLEDGVAYAIEKFVLN